MLRKILVPTDASEPSKKALKTAIAIAQKYDARIELLHVVRNYGDFFSILDALGYEVSEDEMNKYGEPIFNKTIDGMNMEFELQKVIRFGNPAHIILDEIEKENIDIVIIGIQEHRMFYLLRIISRHVMNHAKCPVLIVK
jgi:nucleotide-binding universal stress UspA family protein